MANKEHLEAVLAGDKEIDRLRSYRGGKEFDLSGVELPTVDLSGRRLDRIDLRNANLAHALLSGSEFRFCNLSGVNLSGAHLSGTSFYQVNLEGANFDAAMLEHGTLVMSRLENARLSAGLNGATLRDLTLTGTDFAGATAGGTSWSDLDLRGARSLDQILHHAPSTVGLDTIVRSGGQIPETFLRGCGVPDEVIAYVRSLGQSARPIQLYSCFISHSSGDRRFCERLHADLQAAGVRCWFAPEDLKVGDKFRDEIENAIRVHDKLLLVLSDHSVNSSWVETEVESALERERREGRLMLFPVRVDGAVMDAGKAWAADVRRHRHIADFTDWKNYDAYQRAFQRLLRDLRAAGETV
jgi:hypothetical protein